MANITTQTIRVDLSTDKVIPSAFTHQNDTARTLEFNMYNKGVPHDMTGNTVKFSYKSPIVDGAYTVITGSGMASGTVSGNKVTVTLPSAYTAISGVGILTMIITPSSGTVRPVNIRLVVQKSADGANEIAGASDFPTTLEEITGDWLTRIVPATLAHKIDKPISNPNGSNGQLLATKGDGTTEWVNAGQPTNAQTSAAVNAWLNAHPEATTTVQDGAITRAKINSSFLPYIVDDDYVTPEMYGAKGDGTTDDSVAIQSAIDSGKSVRFGAKTYKTTQPIMIGSSVSFRYKTLDASLAYINYVGEDSAFYISRSSYARYMFGRVYADNGNGFTIRSDASANAVYYIDFDFRIISAKEKCIHIIADGEGYVSHSQFFSGQLLGDGDGVYISESNSTWSTNGINFYYVGFEGLTNGVVFDANGKGIEMVSFVQCRHNEGLDKFIVAQGTAPVSRISVIDEVPYRDTKYTVTSNCDRWVFYNTSRNGNEVGQDVQTHTLLFHGKFINASSLYYSLGGGTALYANDDLNDVTSVGSYYAAGSVSGTLLNKPDGFSSAGYTILRVSALTSSFARSDDVMQEITNSNRKGYMWQRWYIGGAWTDWYRFSSDNGKDAVYIDTGTDLDDLITRSSYYCNAIAITPTLVNKPSDLTGIFAMEVLPMSMNSIEATGSYLVYLQIIRQSNNIYQRRIVIQDGVKTAHSWYKFTGTAV